jgi:hypothetical protein
MQTAVCAVHWDQMYYMEVPDYIGEEQMLQYKRLSLEKKIWKV